MNACLCLLIALYILVEMMTNGLLPIFTRLNCVLLMLGITAGIMMMSCSRMTMN